MRRLSQILMLAFVFSLPWESAILVNSIGRGSRLLGVAAAVAWGFHVLQRGRIRQLDRLHKALFLVLAWIGLSMYWTLDFSATFSGFLTMGQIFVSMLIIWDIFRTEKEIESVLQALVFGAFVAASSVILNFLTTPTARFAEHQRFQAFDGGVDGIALILAIAAPAAWYLASRRTVLAGRRWVRMINFAYIPLGLFALTLTGTRGAVVASIPTAIFILWSLRLSTRAHRVVAIVAVCLAAVGVIWFAPPESVTRIASTVTELRGGGDLSGRRDIWTQSTKSVFERPMLGAGFDAHRAAVDINKEAHNTPLSILVETGIVGLLLFGWVVMEVVLHVRRRSGWALMYWSMQLLVFAVGSLSLSIESQKLPWIIAALAVSSSVATQGSGAPEPKSTSVARYA